MVLGTHHQKCSVVAQTSSHPLSAVWLEGPHHAKRSYRCCAPHTGPQQLNTVCLYPYAVAARRCVLLCPYAVAASMMIASPMGLMQFSTARWSDS